MKCSLRAVRKKNGTLEGPAPTKAVEVMMRNVMVLLVCGGCVLNSNVPTEQAVLDDGAIRVAPLRLTLQDGEETEVLEELFFDRPGPFAQRHSNRLPFEYADHRMALEAGQVANMVAVGGQVGLTVDGEYSVVSLTRSSGSETPGSWGGVSREQVLDFDFTLEGRVVHASLEVDVDYHCPPFPTEPATPERDGHPSVSAPL